MQDDRESFDNNYSDTNYSFLSTQNDGKFLLKQQYTF